MTQPERERQLRRDFVRCFPINVDQSLLMMREYDEDAVEQLRDEDLDPDATCSLRRPANR